MAGLHFVSTVQSASLHHADVTCFLEDAKAKFAATMMILSSEFLTAPSVLTLACDFSAGWTATSTSTCDPTMLQQRFLVGLGPKYIDRQVLELMLFVQEKFQTLVTKICKGPAVLVIEMSLGDYIRKHQTLRVRPQYSADCRQSLDDNGHDPVPSSSDGQNESARKRRRRGRSKKSG